LAQVWFERRFGSVIGCTLCRMTTITFSKMRAQNLGGGDGPFNAADPYVYLQLDGCEPLRSATIDNTQEPFWEDALTFEGVSSPASKILEIAIYDDDTFKDDKIGGYKLDLGTLAMTADPQELTVVVDDGVFSDASFTFTIQTDGSWGNPPPDNLGNLVVKIAKCTGLDDADYAGTTDPYCYLQIDGSEAQQTSKKEGTINPEWDEELTFENIQNPLSKTLKITIYDDDTWSRDDKIGQCEVDLAELMANEEKTFELGVDFWLFGLVKQATLEFTLTAVEWGNFAG